MTDLDREAYSEARRLWKQQAFMAHYSLSPDRFDQIMQNLRRRSRRRYIAKIVATIALITAALVLLAWHLGSTS